MAEQTMLLMEPEDMLRRTVSLTARSLGMSGIHEAATIPQARRLLCQRPYLGAVIAIDDPTQSGNVRDFTLVDEVREGQTACDAKMPIAVLTAHADAALIAALRGREVQRVILKPFRAKVLLEAFVALGVPDPATAPVGKWPRA
ncbi:hypothetical protein IP91_01818 [Pseudoduganella lurida]|uniref:Response regulatory domain-containing protein n=1 Tax=Pseudoduganella lurida TaxID=1036180 RepID=A0A562RF55_9BURK|nr:response regulator [Pseudoduganella lurida]TWI67699.1 hypothetical protein IP91_01818 [Pseudoduganella lurida]